jgi:hypothetical protein
VTSAVSPEILESDGFDVKTLPDVSSEEPLAKSSILSVRVPEPEEEIEQERRRRRRRAGQRFEEAKSPPLPVTVLSESPVEVVAGEPLPEVMAQEGIMLKPNVEIPLDDRARRRRRSTGLSKTTVKPRERKERKEVSEELPLDKEAVEKEPKAKTVRAKRKRLPAPPRKRRKSESADEGAEAIKELTLDLQNQAPSGQNSPPEDSPAE